MWFNKKSKEKTIEVDSTTQVERTVVIPEPTVTKVEYKGNPSGHNEFNTIVEFENARYRVTSQNSHEVVRLNCVTKTYEFEDAYDEEESYCVYIKNVKEERWCKKLYITDNGRFFWQCIYSNDSVKYCTISRTEMQKELMSWENPNAMNKIIYHSDGTYDGRWITKPGTYKNKHCMDGDRYYWNWETFFESYEIINKKLYDEKLIEVF